MVLVVEEEVVPEAEAAEVHLQTHLEEEVEALVEEAVASEATIMVSKVETTKVEKMVMISQKNLKNQIITTVEV